MSVQKRAARVSGIYRCVRLKKVIELPAETGPSLRANDAERNSVVQSKRIADCYYPLANPKRIAITQIAHGKLRAARHDLEQRDVGSFIVALDRRGKLAAVMQCDRDVGHKLRRAFLFGSPLARAAARLAIRDKVKVGSNISALIYDEAAAKTLTALGGRTHIHDNFIYALGDRRHIKHHGFSLRCRCQTLPPAPCQSLVQIGLSVR